MYSRIAVFLLVALPIWSAGTAQAGASKRAPAAKSSPAAKPTPTVKPAPATRPPATSVPPNQIAVVDGIPILDEEWDRLAKPYFEEVEARAGRPISDDEKRLLRRNVLDELIRERLWLADALRRGMRVSAATVESRMKQSPFFKTNGQPDEAKFQAFKNSTTSNYPEIRAQIERALILEDYTRWMERRFGPREAELKKSFEERTSLASIRYFALGPDVISLEPEATTAEIRAYYNDHPDEFETPEETRIQYVRIPITAGAPGSPSARRCHRPNARPMPRCGTPSSTRSRARTSARIRRTTGNRA